MTAFELMDRMTLEELRYWWAYNGIKGDEARQRELEARLKSNMQQRRSEYRG